MTPSSSSWPPPGDPQKERLLELLADEVLDGLTAEESAELERLRATEPGLDPLEFERAAAAAHVAFLENAAQSLPEETRQKLLKTGAKWMKTGGRRGGQQFKITKPMTSVEVPRSSDSRVLGRIGWLAAAVCLAIAVWGWWPKIELTLWPTRAVNAASDRVVVAWKPGTDPTGVTSSGSINWSNTLQRGYLKVSGLKPNDPTKEQYQLWIGDKNQAKPIDGGVFDVVDGSGEVIIQIDPKLKVTDLTMFAVTVEKPGGVVVSELGRVAMLTPLHSAGR